MAKLSQLFTRTNPAEPTARPAAVPAESETAARLNNVTPIEPESDHEVSARLGQACESLRNLIIEAGCKANDLEEARKAFVSIVDPAELALRTLEHEKTRNISLSRTLAQLRTDRDGLLVRFNDLTRNADALASEKEALREDLEEAQKALNELRTLKENLTNEIALGRIVASDYERQVSELSTQTRSLSDENRKYRTDAIEIEAKAGQLEAELTAARENVAMLQGENQSLQSSLEEAAAEISNLSQRNAQMESALSTAKTRIQQMETSLNRFEREHEKLVTEITEVSERERNTQARAQVQLEALQARASMAEKLLANTRQQLAQRNEEARASEREVMEAKRARSAAETLRREVEALVKTHEAHIRELENSRSGLAERSTTLADTLKSRELQLAEADEQRRSAAEQIARLENEIRSGRLTYEKRIDELLAMLDRERLDRQVVEGALDTTRRERAALQHEVYKMRRMQRATPADEPTEAEAEPPRSGRHIDAA